MFKKEHQTDNFWRSAEIDCISRNFSYEEYLSKLDNPKFHYLHAALSKESYIKLNEIFNNELQLEFQHSEYNKYWNNDDPDL